MRICTAAVILILISNIRLAAQPSVLLLRQVDSVFSSWNSRDKPGGVVAIVQHGKTIYKQAFGMADVTRHVPNNVATQFEIASMAKQFTAMCIALLEEQGKLSCEDDIGKFFPEFRFNQVVKVRNLLDHTSGIREAYVLAVLSGKVNFKGEVPAKRNTKKFLLDIISRERDLNFEPGTEMVYTNINYVLLGEIVERVSKQSLHNFADSAIFKPLGMKSSFIRDQRDHRGAQEAYGYLKKKNRFKRMGELGGIVGDHNMVTTLDDMILWTANFRDNKLGKRDPALIVKVTTSSLLNNGDSTRYGYGLNTYEDRGVKKVGHGGDDGSHTCIATMYPDHDLTVICLTNSSRYSEMEEKANQLGELFLGKYFRKKTIADTTRYIHVPLVELEKKVGEYYKVLPNGLGQFRRVKVKDGSLYLSASPYHDGMRLSAITHDYFNFVHPAWGTAHVTFRDSAGVVILNQGWREDPRVDFKPMKNGLSLPYKDFRGAFWNESTDATIKVKSRKNKIVARKGILRIPLIPFDNDLFYAPQHDALFMFSRDEKGRIARLKINARDFRNFKMVKK